MVACDSCDICDICAKCAPMLALTALPPAPVAPVPRLLSRPCWPTDVLRDAVELLPLPLGETMSAATSSEATAPACVMIMRTQRSTAASEPGLLRMAARRCVSALPWYEWSLRNRDGSSVTALDWRIWDTDGSDFTGSFDDDVGDAFNDFVDFVGFGDAFDGGTVEEEKDVVVVGPPDCRCC